MKKEKDKFSKQSSFYKRFRPDYPETLYHYILSFVPVKNSCLDCGTGNGQVASVLAEYFEKVYASDVSESQLEKAIKKENITYTVQRAEQTDFLDNTFDLITVAQAIHWFDLNYFNQEVKRLLKPNGVLAVWGYGLFRTHSTIDEIVVNFYSETIGSYWNVERKHIDTNYESIEINLEELKVDHDFFIGTRWTLKHLEGYLNSWSAVQNYKNDSGKNPVPKLIRQLEPLWEKGKQRLRFPIFLRIFRS